MATAEPLRGVATYRSIHHPGTRPYAFVFSQRLVRPISVLFLPLMVASLVAALQYTPIIGVLLWGFPAATLLAFGWTAFKLRTDLAEVRIEGRSILLRSVRDVSSGRVSGRGFVPLYDVRTYGEWMVVGAGDADYVFARDEWHEFDALLADLRLLVYGT